MKSKIGSSKLHASVQQYTQGRSPQFPPSGKTANYEDSPKDIAEDASGALQNTGPTNSPQNGGQNYSDVIS